MSEKASPQKTLSGREIPNRRIADISNIPSDYSTTRGDPYFPQLQECRESPLAKTPPANMAKIPGVTSPGEIDVPKENGVEVPKPRKEEKVTEDNPQFEMDI